MKILVVEDDPNLGSTLVRLLRRHVYAVDLATDGAEALERMAVHDYDLAVLDLGLPEPDGLTLIRTWRAEGQDLPILIVSAREGVEERIRALDLGADDYLAKPFDRAELLARIRSLLRRRSRPFGNRLSADGLEMDRRVHRASFRGRDLDLSPKEFALLEYLLLHRGEVVRRSEIAEHVWDSSFDSLTNLIDVFVYRLRRKLDDRSIIRTVKGVGYCFGTSEDLKSRGETAEHANSGNRGKSARADNAADDIVDGAEAEGADGGATPVRNGERSRW